MLRLRVPLLLTLLLAPVLARAQNDAGLWRFVDPNAKALISIDWARIRQSQAGAAMREQWFHAPQATAIPGSELMDDIDHILISSPTAKSAGPDADPLLLIAAHGHFDTARVHALFTHFSAKPQMYNSFQVYRMQGKLSKDMAYVLFDRETILFGDAPSIFATLDRNRFGAPQSQPVPAAGSILARAAQMDASYDSWVIMDGSDMIFDDTVASMFQREDTASQPQAFEAGVNLRSGLVADITVRFQSDDSAKQITSELTRMLNAFGGKINDATWRDTVKNVKVGVEGTAMKINVRLNERELEQTERSFAASIKSQPAAQTATAMAAAKSRVVMPPKSAPLPPPKPAVIRIQGLDDGEHDIPYPPQN